LTSGKAKTFYIPAGTEKQWNRYLELCDAKLGTSGSKRINTLWLNDLAALEGTESTALQYSLDDEISLRIAIEKKERDLLKALTDTELPNRKSLFEIMHDLAVSLGTDETLSKDLPTVRQRLLEYKISPRDGFTQSQKILFATYLTVVLERRAINDKIEAKMLSAFTKTS